MPPPVPGRARYAVGRERAVGQGDGAGAEDAAAIAAVAIGLVAVDGAGIEGDVAEGEDAAALHAGAGGEIGGDRALKQRDVGVGQDPGALCLFAGNVVVGHGAAGQRQFAACVDATAAGRGAVRDHCRPGQRQTGAGIRVDAAASRGIAELGGLAPGDGETVERHVRAAALDQQDPAGGTGIDRDVEVVAVDGHVRRCGELPLGEKDDPIGKVGGEIDRVGAGIGVGQGKRFAQRQQVVPGRRRIGIRRYRIGCHVTPPHNAAALLGASPSSRIAGS